MSGTISTTSTISSGSKDSSCSSPVPSARSSSLQVPSRYPTPAPSADAEHSFCDVLRRLAGLEGEATADGRLPATVLSRAVSICNEVRGLDPSVWAAASASAAWADPRTRRGLVTLLSYTIRQLLEGRAVTGAYSAQLPLIFEVLITSLDDGPVGLVPRGRLPAVALEVVRLLVATDTVQCLTRLLEAVTPTVVAAAAVAVDAAASGEDEAPSRQTPSTDTHTRADNHVLYPLYRLLQSLSGACSAAAPFGDQPGTQAALRQLRSALLRSRTLEHATRSTILMARQVTAPDGGHVGAEAAMAKVDLLVQSVALSLVGVLTRMNCPPDAAAEVWTRAAVSGACVQHFLLLHAVSQLCAADGGPDYGLPPGARLPPLGDAGGSDDGGYHPSLWPDLVAISFRWWAHNWDRLQEQSRPCSPRALRVVCERAAAAGIASACWGSDSAAAVVAVTDGAGLTGCRFTPPESAMAITLTALWCAVRTLPHDGSVAAAADSRRLWVPVVQAARAALHVRSNPGLSFGLTPLQLLLEMPRPRLSALCADTVGSLPAKPGPELAAALAAGYLPTLEQTIRHEARSAGNSPEKLRPVLHRICSLLSDLDGLAALLAYSDLTHASALLATCIKVVAAAAAGDIFIRAHLQTMLDHTALVASGGCCRPPGLGPADRFWWRRRGNSSVGGLSGGGGGLCRAAELPAPLDAVGAVGIGDRGAGGTRGSGNGGVDTGANGSSSDGTGAAASSDGAHLALPPPLHRLSLLGTFAATRLLPVLQRILLRGIDHTYHFEVILPWFLPLLEAYRQCNTPTPAASEATQLAADGAATATTKGTAADAAAALNRRRQDAASWERLLLGELDVPGMLQEAARELAMDSNAGRGHCSSLLVAVGLRHLLAAFPLQGRKVLQARISQGAGRKAVPLLDWLQDELAARGGVYDRKIMRYLQLAAAGAAGASQDSAGWLDEEAEDCLVKWQVAMGALLPPPCFVAEALRGLLPMCANPGCTNLEGDSEAGWRVQAAGRSSSGGGGSGAAPCYCCRACQRAHSRA